MANPTLRPIAWLRRDARVSSMGEDVEGAEHLKQPRQPRPERGGTRSASPWPQAWPQPATATARISTRNSGAANCVTPTAVQDG